jgi:hypothetical protein
MDSVSSFANNIVGPIAKDYCLYFYVLALLSAILFAIAVIGGVYHGITHNKKGSYYGMLFINSFSLLIGYLVNRLLYNMCVKTL